MYIKIRVQYMYIKIRAPVEVNVDTAYDTGQQIATQFIANLPHGFDKPISKRVVNNINNNNIYLKSNFQCT